MLDRCWVMVTGHRSVVGHVLWHTRMRSTLTGRPGKFNGLGGCAHSLRELLASAELVLSVAHEAALGKAARAASSASPKGWNNLAWGNAPRTWTGSATSAALKAQHSDPAPVSGAQSAMRLQRVDVASGHLSLGVAEG